MSYNQPSQFNQGFSEENLSNRLFEVESVSLDEEAASNNTLKFSQEALENKMALKALEKKINKIQSNEYTAPFIERLKELHAHIATLKNKKESTQIALDTCTLIEKFNSHSIDMPETIAAYKEKCKPSSNTCFILASLITAVVLTCAAAMAGFVLGGFLGAAVGATVGAAASYAVMGGVAGLEKAYTFFKPNVTHKKIDEVVAALDAANIYNQPAFIA